MSRHTCVGCGIVELVVPVALLASVLIGGAIVLFDTAQKADQHQQNNRRQSHHRYLQKGAL